MSLLLLDNLYTFVHLLIIVANLLAWVWFPTRKIHLYVVGITLFCWFILGIWYGIGYCPVTDWQWEVKTKLGETNLPNSFVKYHLDKMFAKDIPDIVIDLITLITFLIAIICSLKVNFFSKKTNCQKS